MIDVFEETKARLTMQDVAQHYGFTPNRAGFIKCPFHAGDRTASMKIYPGRRGFHCFACNCGGSVIDFAARLFNLSPLGAVRQLDRDFSLGLPIDRQQTPQERAEAARAAAKRQELSDTAEEYEAWRGAMLDKLTIVFRTAYLALKDYQCLDDLTEAEALAVQWQTIVEYWADCLLLGDMGVQMDIFRDRKGVEALCNQILNSTPMKSGAA